jgi:cytochrome c biogenesis protein CcmG/thiol:disulfide interchange protein DsbE
MRTTPSGVDTQATPAAAAPERRPARRRHPVRWTVVGVGVTVLMVTGVILGRNLGRNPDPSLVRSPLLGKPAPQWELPRLDDDGALSSAQLTGRPYVVNFWASWCVPCRAEAPHLQAFAQRHARDGIALVGIVWSDDAGNARAFREEFGLTYPQLTDPGTRTALDYGVFGVPETYVVDGGGIVMAKLVGAVGPTTLDDVLAQVLSGEEFTSENDQYRRRPP